MSPILISILAFGGVAGVLGAVAYVFRDRQTSAEDRLVSLLTNKPQAEGEQVEIWKKAAFDTDRKNFLEQVMPKLPKLDKLFIQAEAHIRPSSLMGISVVLAVLGASASWLLGVPKLLLPLPACLLFSIPWLWLLNKRRVRMKKFGSQLPDALELVARALRAGHSLAAGLHVVSEEMPAPISTEFGRVYEEQNLGIQLEEALRSMCDRMPNLDLRFFVTSVAIQRTTGGDLSEILDKIGYVIRERYRILGQVKALTGEGRLSGVVLIALPFLLFFVILHIQPQYVEMLWTTEDGIKMSIFALVMQVLGALCIRKIVNIKV